MHITVKSATGKKISLNMEPENTILQVKQAIQELVGSIITSGSDLKGLIYGYIHDNKDKDAEIRTLRASMSMASRRAPSSSAAVATFLTSFCEANVPNLLSTRRPADSSSPRSSSRNSRRSWPRCPAPWATKKRPP